jgi:DNA-directed RNA polymerase specialized sigma24 family protein
MSAQAELRKRRADAIIERDYAAMREHVLGTVAGKLRRRSIFFSEADLDAHYNTAWQGLYSQLLEGEKIENPTGWLVQAVTWRAVDASRRIGAQAVNYELDEETVAEVARESDVATRLDDYTKLQHFTEALKDRLSTRECEAATLCYIHGFTRRQAAEILGFEERRMEKIMDAVSKKVGALIADIESGAWCDSRSSLMKAYALGILDPDGKRYELATEHLRQCPGCRRYVRSMRGLAAMMPPVALPLHHLGGDGGGGLLEALHGLVHTAARHATEHAEPLRAAKAGVGAAATGGGAAVAGSSGAGAAAAPAVVASTAPAAGTATAAAATGSGAGAVAATTGGGIALKATATAVAVLVAGGGAVGATASKHTEAGRHGAAPRQAAQRQTATPSAPALPAGVTAITVREPGNASLITHTTSTATKSHKAKPKHKTKRKATTPKRRTVAAPIAKPAVAPPAPKPAVTFESSTPATTATPTPRPSSSSTSSSSSEFSVEGG